MILIFKDYINELRWVEDKLRNLYSLKFDIKYL